MARTKQTRRKKLKGPSRAEILRAGRVKRSVTPSVRPPRRRFTKSRRLPEAIQRKILSRKLNNLKAQDEVGKLDKRERQASITRALQQSSARHKKKAAKPKARKLSTQEMLAHMGVKLKSHKADPKPRVKKSKKQRLEEIEDNKPLFPRPLKKKKKPKPKKRRKLPTSLFPRPPKKRRKLPTSLFPRPPKKRAKRSVEAIRKKGVADTRKRAFAANAAKGKKGCFLGGRCGLNKTSKRSPFNPYSVGNKKAAAGACSTTMIAKSKSCRNK